MTEQQQDRSTSPESRGLTDDVRRRAIEAYDSARDGVSGAGRKAADTLEQAPLLALAGGLAAGAIIAALLPRTRTESKLLQPVGGRLTGTAKAAAQAARDAGTARLNELGLTKDAGMETLRSIFEGASDAAKTSAQAAVGTVRGGKER